MDTAPGLLDYPVDGVRAQNRFTRELDKLNNDTESLGRKLGRPQRLTERLAGRRPRWRQWAANWSARSIDRSASYIEKRLALFKKLVKDIERNSRGFIETSALEVIDVDATTELRNVIDQGITTTEETLASVTGYRASVEEMEAMNLSRTIRIASGRLAEALRGIEAVFRAHEKRRGDSYGISIRSWKTLGVDRDGVTL